MRGNDKHSLSLFPIPACFPQYCVIITMAHGLSCIHSSISMIIIWRLPIRIIFRLIHMLQYVFSSVIVEPHSMVRNQNRNLTHSTSPHITRIQLGHIESPTSYGGFSKTTQICRKLTIYNYYFMNYLQFMQ